MSCNIVINQQASLPISDNITPETKVKDPKRAEAAHKGRENYTKKLKDQFLKEIKIVQITLKEFINYFQQDLNDTASTLTAIKKIMPIVKKSTILTNISIRII